MCATSIVGLTLTSSCTWTLKCVILINCNGYVASLRIQIDMVVLIVFQANHKLFASIPLICYLSGTTAVVLACWLFGPKIHEVTVKPSVTQHLSCVTVALYSLKQLSNLHVLGNVWHTGECIQSVSQSVSQHSGANFAQYFSAKIDAVRAETAFVSAPSSNCSAAHQFEPCSMVTAAEVVNLLNKAANKASQLDPAPKWLIKHSANLLTPFIANLFSLASDCLFSAEI